jgi:RNA polymerase sigma-70 factor (ECF subfamily)
MTDHEFAERLAVMRETIYRVSCSHLSRGCDRDDAVQETLLKAWSNRNRLRNERYMQTWVVRILINECHNIQRKQAREILETPPEQENYNESSGELRDALFRLDEKLRVPVVLHYIEGYHVREIAKILGIPRGTVLWRMSKARKELKAMLNDDSDGIVVPKTT